MGVRNRVIDEICKALRKLKANEFDIKLRAEFGTPEENTEELKQLLTRDFDAMRSRTDETNLFIGRFMGAVLLIEAKLDSLLVKVDSDIGSKMLGAKIDLYKRLLNELTRCDYGYEDDIDYFREIILPIKEIATIRNNMAHDLRYTEFSLNDLANAVKLVRRRKLYLDHAMLAAPARLKPLVAAMNLAFIVSETLAFLEQKLA